MAKKEKKAKKNPFKGKKGKSERVRLDLSGVSSGYRIEAGKYRAKLVAMEAGVSQNSGNEMYTLTWQIIEGKYKGKKQGKFKQFCALTEGALWRYKQVLEALDLVGEEGLADFEISEAIGLEAVLTIKDDQNQNGDDVSKVDKVSRSPNGPGGDEEGDSDDEEDADDEDEEDDEDSEDSDDSEDDDEDEDSDDDEDSDEDDDADEDDEDDSDEDDDDDDSDDEDDSDEDEDEEEPPKKAKKSKKEKKSSKPVKPEKKAKKDKPANKKKKPSLK